jgi:hypothetical protein
VLANASLDVAMHDTFFIDMCNTASPLLPFFPSETTEEDRNEAALFLPNNEHSDDIKLSNDEYIKMF